MRVQGKITVEEKIMDAKALSCAAGYFFYFGA
jgi:hypothetical protein